MTHVILAFYFFFQIPLKMFLYRARGKSWSWSTTQANRVVFWGLPYAIDGMIFSYLLGAHDVIPFGVLSVSAAFFSTVIGHGKWQGPGSLYNCTIMGLITTGMLTLMLLPFIFLDVSLLAYVPLGMLGFVASWLGYNGPWANSTLQLFGVVWCRPVIYGGSEWEELGIGAFPFGITIYLIGLHLLGLL